MYRVPCARIGLIITIFALLPLLIPPFITGISTYKVLRLRPDCHPSVRVGIGLCCSKLGQKDKARAAFERALALEPESVEASIGVALSDLHLIPRGAKDRVKRQKQAVRRINRLSQRGVTNPMVLNQEANHR